MPQLNILKTYKIFIGGAFPRTESGRYYKVTDAKNNLLANACLSSRKDFRNAVVAARKAFEGWSKKTHFNRGQILYRMAEMLEGRRSQFKEEIMAQGSTPLQAEKEIQLSIERCVYYSGWCDKYSALYSSVNPVASAHFNFSVPEPMGVVSVIAPEDSSLLGLLSVILPVIAGGNVCVVLASETKPLCSITFAEVLATSDLPAGVVNILTGKSKELHTHFSNHMDVNAVIYGRDNQAEQKTIEENASINVKRSFCWHKDWSSNEHQNPYLIMDLQEIKTTWHPIESIGIGGAKY
ncbi:MAG: aldehyde dehydrogenase family protein [Bacteroidetes bacterium]|nr:aldehyde dehydrogenase family protein [Bacteroidota bacterium]MBK9300763.1 aldehyde dehydrogenase family protein [Bacteroidota bacterium]